MTLSFDHAAAACFRSLKSRLIIFATFGYLIGKYGLYGLARKVHFGQGYPAAI